MLTKHESQDRPGEDKDVASSKSFQELLKCHKRFKKMERAPPVWGLRRAVLQEVGFKVGLRHLL